MATIGGGWLLWEEDDIKKYREKRKENCSNAGSNNISGAKNTDAKTHTSKTTIQTSKKLNYDPNKRCAFEHCGKVGHSIGECYKKNKLLMP